MNQILVIDDQASARLTAEGQLAALACNVRSAAGGHEALALLVEHDIDLIVCDAMLPELDGFSVCRAIRANPRWRAIPVLLLTALDDPADLVRGIEAGADEFLSKPVSGPVLRAKVSALLRMRARYTELEVQPELEARREQIITTAQLTAREREVLELLMLGREHEDISTALEITIRTSKFHQTNLLRKLGAESRMDLLRVFT